MRHLAEATARIAGNSFKRKYIALGRIVNSWAEIVGAELALKAQPLKIRYFKRPNAKDAESILEIAVSDADATLLYYQKGLILERINQVFGDAWVKDIRFVSRPVQPQARRFDLQKRPLTEAEKNTLSLMLEEISDTDIKNRLSSLGQAVIMGNKA